MKKFVILLSAVTFLSSFGSAQKAGDFVFSRQTDLITDDDISYFYTAAINSDESSSSSPRLYFGCSNKQPYIYVNARDIVGVNSDENAIVRIRFDQGTPSNTLFWPRAKDIYVANMPQDQFKSFVVNAKKAQQVVVQLKGRENDSLQFQFGLNKLDFMLSKLVCGKLFEK